MECDLKLVFPTKEYQKQVQEYLQEHFDNHEYELNGDGGLDTIKDFDKWLEKVKNDVSEKTIEMGRVPATLFLGVRKSDNKVVGMLQIRHYLNESLLKNGGHIGDGVRPSERRKGYATQMIRLALEKCKKLGIQRVLMVCYKDNIGSRKSIEKNGGILENELPAENGRIDQRYWISLKKRFANYISKAKDVLKIKQNMKSVKEKDFSGDIYLNEFVKMSSPAFLENGLCVRDNHYKWLQFYDYASEVCLTTIYNEKNEIVEWYFDMARKIGKENGVPYEDDLYLDVVLKPNGEIVLLDEDELQDAFERMEMTKQEFDEAYETAKDLMKRLQGNQEKVKRFTDKYLQEMLE